MNAEVTDLNIEESQMELENAGKDKITSEATVLAISPKSRIKNSPKSPKKRNLAKSKKPLSPYEEK